MKIISFNVENLFFSPQPKDFSSLDEIKASVTQPGDKDYPVTKLLGQSIKQMDPDIAGLMEVGGVESLEAFNEVFLDQKFETSLIPGNSDRDIHLGYLVKKNLPYRYEHYTHRNRKIKHREGNSPSYLSRDIAELRLFDPEDKEGEAPKLIILCVHLKSKRSSGADFGGQKRRAAEFNLVLDTYIYLEKRYKSQVPILLMGDFNNVILPGELPESFGRLFEETDLVDILEILDYPMDQRGTQISFSSRKDILSQQFDYIFVPKKWHSLINQRESGLYLFRHEENDQIIRKPQSSHERSQLPSDHYPLICDLTLPR